MPMIIPIATWTRTCLFCLLPDLLSTFNLVPSPVILYWSRPTSLSVLCFDISFISINKVNITASVYLNRHVPPNELFILIELINLILYSKYNTTTNWIAGDGDSIQDVVKPRIEFLVPRWSSINKRAPTGDSGLFVFTINRIFELITGKN